MNDPDGDPDVVYYREQISGLEHQIQALEEQIGDVRGRLGDRTTRLIRLRGELGTLQWAERLAVKNAARTVPVELESAIRDAGPARWLSAWIPLGRGKQLLVTLGGDTVAASETEIWHYLDAAHREPPRGIRIGPFIRAELPRPLAAYVNEQAGAKPVIVLGTWLNGEDPDAVRAIRLSWQAHRPGRRLWSILFLPLVVGLRGLRHLLPSPAAVPVATGVAATAMPVITAAVISSPIITSLHVDDLGPHRGPVPQRLAPVDSHSALPPLVRRTTETPLPKGPAGSTGTNEPAPPAPAKEQPPATAGPLPTVDQRPPPAEPAPVEQVPGDLTTLPPPGTDPLPDPGLLPPTDQLPDDFTTPTEPANVPAEPAPVEGRD